MSDRRHPSEAVLTDYAAGALRPAFAVVVATHLEGCAHCRGQVAAMEAAAGELIAALEPVALSDDALDRTLARIERGAGPPAPTGPVTGRLSFGRRMWLAPGAWIAKAAPADAQGDLLYMLRLPAGIAAIDHGHQGVEFTAVLEGAFTDETGTYCAGDFAEVDDDLRHRPTIAPDAPCVCLIASAAPMRAKSWVGRAVQALAGV